METGDFAFDQIKRSSSETVTVIVFGVAEFDWIARSKKQQRVLADAQNHRARFALLEILLHVHAAMLSETTI